MRIVNKQERTRRITTIRPKGERSVSESEIVHFDDSNPETAAKMAAALEAVEDQGAVAVVDVQARAALEVILSLMGKKVEW